MSKIITSTLLILAAGSASMQALAQSNLPALDSNPSVVSLKEFQRLFEASKSWGEFGDDDQLGSLNLITPLTRVRAASLVTTGTSVSLANPLSKTANGNFIEPLGHKTFVFDLPPGFDGGESAAGDVFNINYHGGIHSHMDGVAHFG